MPAKKKYGSETIARWRRDKDGYELHLRRDGRAFFWVPFMQKWMPAAEQTTMELIEKWRMNDGIGFVRLEPPRKIG